MTRSRRGRGSVYLGLAGGLFLASGALLGGYFLLAGGDSHAVAGRAESGEGAGAHPQVLEEVIAAAEEFASGEAIMHYGDDRVAVPWRDLGVTVDREAAAVLARRLGEEALGSIDAERVRGSGPLPLVLDRDRALDELMALKEQYDRSPRNARLDLEGRKVHPHSNGFGVDAYGSLGPIEAAARAGETEVELPGVRLTADVTIEDLGVDDISHVLGTFTTRFAVADRDRNYNLKLAASKLDGYVLEPGVRFSFNDVLGPRTEKEGYKIAGVITAGEMVDGLAGGTCQISSTLHGAAFFAGIGLIESIPHSRPSTYVTMGLDATVFYPHVDLKMINNYDFPVVIHYKVARGESTVEILGPERPYDTIAFERQIEERLDFDTVTREDSELPVGYMAIDQPGFYGYKLKRYRKYYKDGKLVKTDTWNMRYRPVTEYARIGINLDPNLPPPKDAQKKRKTLRPPKKDFHRLTQ